MSILIALLAAQAVPAGGVCEGLRAQWRGVEMEMASHYASGVVDDSAPRATMRAMETGNQLASADIILTLMAANKCSLPKRAPSEMNYAVHALACRTERLKGNASPDACDRTKWTPALPD